MESKKDAKAQRLKNLKFKSRGRGRRGGHGAGHSDRPFDEGDDSSHDGSEDEKGDALKAASSNIKGSRSFSRRRKNLGGNWDRYEDSDEEGGADDKNGEAEKVAVKEYADGRPKSKGADYAALLDEGLADPLSFTNATSLKLRQEDWVDFAEPPLGDATEELKMLSVDLEALNLLLSQLPIGQRLWLNVRGNGVGRPEEDNGDADLCHYFDEGTASAPAMHDEVMGASGEARLEPLAWPESWIWPWSKEEERPSHGPTKDDVSCMSQDMAYVLAKDEVVSLRPSPLSRVKDFGGTSSSVPLGNHALGAANVRGGAKSAEGKGEAGSSVSDGDVRRGEKVGVASLERDNTGVKEQGLVEGSDELDALLGSLELPMTAISESQVETTARAQGVSGLTKVVGSWDGGKSGGDELADIPSSTKVMERRLMAEPSTTKGPSLVDKKGIGDGRHGIVSSLAEDPDDVDLDFDTFMDTLK